MLDRLNPALRILCLVLAGLAVLQMARLAARRTPLQDLNLAASEAIGAPSEAQKSPAAPAPTNAPSSSRSANKNADLDPTVQARIERVTQSEILGQVVRPLPMALLGLAGRDALIRAPNGQTGLLREGEELGGLKLLRIGTNRVLIEHEQQQKELMLFSGLGGEPLLPKANASKESPRESPALP